MNEYYDNLMKRRSIRAYKPDAVPARQLEAIAQAGLNAPSAMNQQAWEIAVVTDKSTLEELNREVRNLLPPQAIDRITSRTGGDFNFFYGAPALIITAMKNSSLFPQCDCGCAITNMYHAACALGLGSCWINQLSGETSNRPEIRRILDKIGISSDHTVYGCLAVGVPAATPAPKTITGKIIFK